MSCRFPCLLVVAVAVAVAAADALGGPGTDERPAVSLARHHHILEGRRIDRGLLLETREEDAA